MPETVRARICAVRESALVQLLVGGEIMQALKMVNGKAQAQDDNCPPLGLKRSREVQSLARYVISNIMILSCQ